MKRSYSCGLPLKGNIKALARKDFNIVVFAIDGNTSSGSILPVNIIARVPVLRLKCV
jgi:hypothetical protein